MTGQPPLNVAATRVGTRTLGPGVRSVVWVQGCPFHCLGCLAPEWIPNAPRAGHTPTTSRPNCSRTPGSPD